jgi:surface polysaccharide O-acyltransferase-like enzyme
LLLDPAKEEPPAVFYRKRLARLGVPLVFWSLFFMAFDVHHNHWSTWGKSLANLAQGKPYAHLHFVYRIAVLYAFTPMFRVFVRHASRGMLVASMIILFAIWSADSMINAFNATTLSAFASFAPFVSYYLAGYVLRESYLSRGQMKWAATMFVASAAVMAVVTGLLTRWYGFKWYPSVPMILYDFLSPVRIPLAISAWLILITLFRQEGRWSRLWAVLAPTTLGLYLIHPAFREVLYVNGYSVLWRNIYMGVPLITMTVYTASLLSVAVLMRIPVVRRIVL